MIILEPIIKLIAKPLGSAPGWALLMVASFWFVETGRPQRLALELFGLGETQIPETVWALGLTVIFYVVGDWLDNFVYKKRVAVASASGKKHVQCDRFDPAWVDRKRTAAREALKVQDGSYRVALDFVVAADKSTAVKFANELAKFLRSLVVPFLLVAIFGFWAISLKERGLFVGSAVVGLVFYVLLKQFHIWLLYRQVIGLTSDSKYRNEKVGNLLYFYWDGEILTSADPDKTDDCRPKEPRSRSEESTR